jgi:hypothetical protein
MYAEATYFEGYQFAHIVTYEEELRLRRIRRVSARLVERRTGSRGRR